MTDLEEMRIRNDVEKTVRDEWDTYVIEQDLKILELKQALEEACDLFTYDRAEFSPHSDEAIARIAVLRKLTE